MADIKERIVIEAVDNTTRGMRTAQNKLNAFDRTLKRVQTTMLGFVGINIATQMVIGLTKASDSAIELDAKLRLMTDGVEDFNKASKELVEISLESGSSLSANTILFTRMNKAVQRLGGDTQKTLDITRLLSQGLRISGASTQESASVIRQVSQAFSSGILRGEEFNAVMENGGRLAIALADGLGVDVGALRAMAKEGELAADRVIEAWLSQSKVIADENAQLPLTIGRAIENVNTQWTEFLKTLKGKNTAAAGFISSIADNFELLATAIAKAGDLVLLYYGAKTLAKLSAYGAKLQEMSVARLKMASDEKVAYVINAQRDAKQAVQKEKLFQEEKQRIAEKAALNDKKYIKKRERDVKDAENEVRKAKNSVKQNERINVEIVQQEKLIQSESAKRVQLSETGIIEAKNQVSRAKYNNSQLLSISSINTAKLNTIKLLIEEQRIQLQFASKLGNNKRLAELAKLNVLQQRANALKEAESIVNQKVIRSYDAIRMANKGVTLAIHEKTVAAKESDVILLSSNAKIEASTNKLKVSQTLLNEKIVEQTILLDRNSFAKTANTSATVGLTVATNASTAANIANNASNVGLGASAVKAGKGVGILKTGFSFVTKWGGRALSMLGGIANWFFGIPGMVAYGAYELVDYFFGWGEIIDDTSAKLDKMHHTWRTFQIDRKSIGATGELAEQYREERRLVDEHYGKQIAKRKAYDAAIAGGFNSIAEHRASTLKDQMDKENEVVREIQSLNNKKVELEAELVGKLDAIQKQKEDKYKTHLERMKQEDGLDNESLEEAKAKAKAEAEIKASLLEEEYKNEEDKQTALNKIKSDSFDEMYKLETDNFEKRELRYKEFYASELSVLESGSKQYLTVEKEMVVALDKLNDKRVESARSMVSKLIASNNEIVGDVKDAKDKLRSIEEDHKNFMLKVHGDTRTEWQKEADAQKEFSANASKLRKADVLDQKGKGKEAQALRDQVRTDLKALYEAEVKRSEGLQKGSLEELKARSSVTNAMNLYKEATNDSIKAQETAISTGEVEATRTQEKINALISQIGEMETASAKARDEVKRINDELAALENVELNVTINTKVIFDQISEIDRRIDALSKTITITTVEKKVEAKQSGGLIYRKDGGFIPRKDKVPGSGSGDKVKALLEPGEFVMRKSAVQKYGESMMYRLNGGDEDEPEKRQSGGLIGKFARGGAILTKRKEDDIDPVDAIFKEYSAKTNKLIESTNAPSQKLSFDSKKWNDKVLLKYYNLILPVISSLKGKDNSVVSSSMDIINQILNAVKSNKMGKVNPLFQLLNANAGSDFGNVLSSRGSASKDVDDSKDNVKTTDSKAGSYLKGVANKTKEAFNKSVENVKGGGKFATSGGGDFFEDEDEKFNFGGIVQRLAEGGRVVGSGLGDTVKALLTPGEHVINKGAVQKFGSDFLNSINQGIMPERFAAGGMVGEAVTASGETIDININVGGSASVGTFAKTDATMAMIDELRRAEAGS